MTLTLLAEYHLEFLSLKGGFIGSSESTHVKMPHCWKSHVAAQLYRIKEWFLSHENSYKSFSFIVNTYAVFFLFPAFESKILKLVNASIEVWTPILFLKEC